MPRIRKKTSKRSSTNDRRKLTTKVREGKKKKAKAAKKNPQWKSKHKKDPGIPNNFPYKDQILAEVAEQRRQTAEAKQRRKEEKLTARANGSDRAEAAASDVEDDSQGITADGIASLAARDLSHFQAISARQASCSNSDKPPEDKDDTPLLIDHELADMKAVLDIADAIIQVLDVRDPLPCRSQHLERLAAASSGKRILFVLNKIDTCPREVVSAWASYLRRLHPTLLFRAASAFLPESAEATAQRLKGKGKAVSGQNDSLGSGAVIQCLKDWAAEKDGEMPLTVAVVGVTNSGKSAFINSLLQKSALPVYNLTDSSRGPSTTEYASRVTLDLITSVNGSTRSPVVQLIDTPGLSWNKRIDSDGTEDEAESASLRARDILLRCKGRIDRLKDPLPVVAQIVARASTEDLMLQYNLPAFIEGSTESFLAGVAKSQQLVKKRGALDLASAGRLVLRDWNTGKFPRYTLPPSTSTESTESSNSVPSSSSIYADDDTILSALLTKKQMRVSRGLVKLVPGAMEAREAILDEPWAVDELGSEGEDDDDGEEGEAEEGLRGEDEDEDDKEDLPSEGIEQDQSDVVNESQPPARSSRAKQKRKHEDSNAGSNDAVAVRIPGRPAKRVAFATAKSAMKRGLKKADSSKADSSTKTAKSSLQKSTSSVAPKPTAMQKSTVKTASMAKGPAKSAKTHTAANGEEAYDFKKFF